MKPGKPWSEFAGEAPELAQTGRELLYQGADVANAFLATVAPDGGPRLHPVCPVLAEGDLWLFIVNMSPKYRDLVRNGAYALHSMPTPAGGEEFYLRGAAEEIGETVTRRRVRRGYRRPPGRAGLRSAVSLRYHLGAAHEVVRLGHRSDLAGLRKVAGVVGSPRAATVARPPEGLSLPVHLWACWARYNGVVSRAARPKDARRKRQGPRPLPPPRRMGS